MSYWTFAELFCIVCHPGGNSYAGADDSVTLQFNFWMAVGSDEEKLLAELRIERFTIKEANDPSARYRLTALYGGHDLVCRTWWTVKWSAAQGKITDIEGEYSQSCL